MLAVKKSENKEMKLNFKIPCKYVRVTLLETEMYKSIKTSRAAFTKLFDCQIPDILYMFVNC